MEKIIYVKTIKMLNKLKAVNNNKLRKVVELRILLYKVQCFEMSHNNY